MSQKTWTEEEVNTLKGLNLNHDHKFIAEKMGRTLTSIQRKLQTLGIKSKRGWTVEDDEYLKQKNK